MVFKLVQSSEHGSQPKCRHHWFLLLHDCLINNNDLFEHISLPLLTPPSTVWNLHCFCLVSTNPCWDKVIGTFIYYYYFSIYHKTISRRVHAIADHLYENGSSKSVQIFPMKKIKMEGKIFSVMYEEPNSKNLKNSNKNKTKLLALTVDKNFSILHAVRSTSPHSIISSAECCFSTFPTFL